MGTWWTQVLEAAREDFSDLPNAAGLTHLILRLMLAALLGGALGYEREAAGKAAGIRTHMLVSLGAALFVLIPQQAGATMVDLARVATGLITGIGFLGAGAIIKNDDEGRIEGLTTAASIWMTSAIGLAAGMGREATAVISTVLALVVLSAVPHVFPQRNGQKDKTSDEKPTKHS